MPQSLSKVLLHLIFSTKYREPLIAPEIRPRLHAFPGLVIKGSYWHWPQRDRAGNTIDSFVQALGLSFHLAMLQITKGGR